MLLNHRDGGKRKSIIVTNNEVGNKDEQILREKGFSPVDDEWINLGIARYCTWPRIKAAITGITTTGNPVNGNYKFLEEFSMSNGIEANAAFFQLGFLDKTAVALGMHFKEMLPIIWMKAGSVGACPIIEGDSVPDMLVLPENKMGILVNENAFALFEKELLHHPEIQTVFLATDYDMNYRAMVKNLDVKNTFQLYRDYLDHFRLNRGRN
jgi:adenine-specific DNA-methyltransferase